MNNMNNGLFAQQAHGVYWRRIYIFVYNLTGRLKRAVTTST